MARTRVTKRQREILEYVLYAQKSKAGKFLFHLSEFLQDVGGGFVVRRDSHSFANAIGDPFYRRLREDEKELRKFLSRKFAYLKRHGYVTMHKTGSHEWSYVLTSTGRAVVLRVLIAQAKQRHKQDGVLRLLAFDIPEKESRLRSFFRKLLRDLGFEYLQKSVWTSQYPVESELAEIVKLLGTRGNIQLFHAKHINLHEYAPEDKWSIV